MLEISTIGRLTGLPKLPLTNVGPDDIMPQFGPRNLFVRAVLYTNISKFHHRWTPLPPPPKKTPHSNYDDQTLLEDRL